MFRQPPISISARDVSTMPIILPEFSLGRRVLADRLFLSEENYPVSFLRNNGGEIHLIKLSLVIRMN
ncbi:unnamed protein product, partial [Nesidiocoris tenuis]